MAQLAEVLRAQPVQRGAVELGGAADEVVDLRLEGLLLVVEPGVLGDVAAVHEDVGRPPVLRLPGQPVTALEQEDPPPGRRQVAHQRPAAGAAADHDHVVVAHTYSCNRSARMICAAAWISARCENACGKLPRWRPVAASNSSAYRPSGDATRSSRSI